MNSEPPSLEFSTIYTDYHAHVLRYVARLIGREEAGGRDPGGLRQGRPLAGDPRQSHEAGFLVPSRSTRSGTLSEFEGLPNAEIARRLSLSIGTVKIRLHRARARLHDELRRNCRCYYNDRGELMAEPKSR